MEKHGSVYVACTFMVEVHMVLLQHMMLSNISYCFVMELGRGLGECTSIGQIRCTALLLVQKVLLPMVLLLLQEQQIAAGVFF